LRSQAASYYRQRGWAGNTTNKVRFAVCDEKGPRSPNVEPLLPGTASK